VFGPAFLRSDIRRSKGFIPSNPERTPFSV
jgi:hypothetical protein